MNTVNQYVYGREKFSNATSIEVDGVQIDVTECAMSKCGAAPRPPRTGLFGSLGKSATDAHKAAMKSWLSCVNTKCQPKASATTVAIAQQMGAESLGKPSEAPSTRPMSRPPVSIVDEELGNSAGGEGLSEGKRMVEAEESFLKQHRIPLIALGVLAAVGVTYYFMRKK